MNVFRQSVVPANSLGAGLRFATASALALLATAGLGQAAPSDEMILVQLATGSVEGRALGWSESRISLLSRDGQLVHFRPDKVANFRTTSPKFYSYAPGEMRARLYAEFGSAFDVSGTGHYLVVHPKGQKDQWAQRFEDLYRSFYHYFKVRGLALHDAPYPLVAVVFSNRDDYERHSAAHGEKVPPQQVGHYSTQTNRIYLFDVTAGQRGVDWSHNAETIIHEATHQTAFNTGVHNRFASSPRWACEGLAMLFEAPGVWNSTALHTQRDRINPARLKDYRELVQSQPTDLLPVLIAGETSFASHPMQAYAHSWALSFYLSETQPREYTRYLVKLAALPEFQNYPPEQRLADFQAHFGTNLRTVEAQFRRFMAGLK